jgi:hypothetical protein
MIFKRFQSSKTNVFTYANNVHELEMKLDEPYPLFDFSEIFMYPFSIPRGLLGVDIRPGKKKFPQFSRYSYPRDPLHDQIGQIDLEIFSKKNFFFNFGFLHELGDFKRSIFLGEKKSHGPSKPTRVDQIRKENVFKSKWSKLSTLVYSRLMCTITAFEVTLLHDIMPSSSSS